MRVDNCNWNVIDAKNSVSYARDANGKADRHAEGAEADLREALRQL